MTPAVLVATSALTAADRQRLRQTLADRPWFDFYYRCAVGDLAKGLDNRFYHLPPTDAGLVLGIHFDGVDIVSTLGDVSNAVLAELAARPDRAEWHLEPAHVPAALRQTGDRLRRQDAIRYYRCDPLPDGVWDARCRPITRGDAAEVAAFFAAHYPETILSPWMLDLPFVGVWEGDRLVATAGTLVWHRELAACHIGCFLTDPAERGRGLAKVAAQALFHLLRREGMTVAMLGVFEGNVAAWRAYEALGFACVDRRPVLYLDALS
jgi:RimJ/RimL family protein N-acetyltransferase